MSYSNNTNALITIIAAVYNGDAFLTSCIESVRQQSYLHWELLLIDDGSCDRSAEICKKYASLDSRILYLRQPHSGVSAARNTGLRHGHGDYFFFLDCDDCIHPQTLEHELGLMQSLGCVFGGPVLTNVEEDFHLSAHPDDAIPEYRCLSSSELQVLFTNSTLYDLWAIGGKMLARSAVEGIFFQEKMTVSEDTLFLLEVIAHIETPSVILTGSWYFRRLHQDNASYLTTFESKLRQLEALLHLRTRILELYGKPKYLTQLCVSVVFNWYVDSQEIPDADQHADELHQKLLELLHDDYAHFLPIKRKFTVQLYFLCPPLYWFMKKLFWKIHKLLTGKDDPALEYPQYGTRPSGRA